MTPPMISDTSGPVELLPNPDFSFPMQHSATPSFGTTSQTSRRPVSMQLNARRTQNAAQRQSVSALPTFKFNAEDASGLTERTTPPTTPSEETAATPSRRGHRRGVSEFIGGDSRFGMSNAMSTSPTKASHSLPIPDPVPSFGPPAGRKGHAHRRSAAMSSHDVSNIMQPADQLALPRTSTSLPTTPMENSDLAQCPLQFERPVTAPSRQDSKPDEADMSGSTSDDSAERPPSRARVGFSDTVEYIPRPRPLSTISSETDSSVSTMRGHSVNNSINSLISLSCPSPPSVRIPRQSLSTTFEDESKPRSRNSIEISRRIEREGQWLKGEHANLKRPLSESAVSTPSLLVAMDAPVTPRMPQKKKHSFGFDRRRSEPVISLSPDDDSRLSTVSLQEPSDVTDLPPAATPQEAAVLQVPTLQRKSSTKKIKDWAVSRISRKGANKLRKANSAESVERPQSKESAGVPDAIPAPTSGAVAETDLDAVFGQDSTIGSQVAATSSQPRIEVSTPPPSRDREEVEQQRDSDDMSPVVDLDAAMGPYGTPTMSWESRSNSASARRQLHSSRLTRDFAGPGMHYHRRAESAPALAPFEFGRTSTPTQPAMADVFEEEEEEDTPVHGSRTPSSRPTSNTSDQEEGHGVGIQVVDAAGGTQGSTLNWGVEDGLGIQRGWEMERPTTSYGRASPRLSTPIIERRASSIMEETIVEEVSPVEVSPIEIVEDHEEPRASSTTKSSDSSETPTLMATSTSMLALPQSDMTPDSYTLSTFSSPDFSRRQGSFDTSRLGTSASSITDNRTMSSFATGENSHEVRMSVDDVPSLTSSRSTMMSTMHPNTSRRDFSERSTSTSSGPSDAVAAERRRKRSSIASLSHLVGGSFSGLSKIPSGSRPQTALEDTPKKPPKKKKEHRLSKLMFWKSKHSSHQVPNAN